VSDMQLRDLMPAFGTEITGLDPVVALTDEEIQRRLQGLFDRRGVLVFRDLDIDQTEQANLIRMLIGLGPLADGESATGRDSGDPFYVSNKEANGGAPFGRLLFHSDMMWSEHTFRVLSLYGVEVEQPATPTIFASATFAWDTLPADLRSQVGDHKVVQGHDEINRADDPDVLVTKFEDLPTRTTALALPHPKTGGTVLYASQQMTISVEDLPEQESEALLDQLFAHLYRDEALYEHDWRVGDLVAWDNIAIQHARPNVTTDGPARTLRKLFAPVPPRSASPRRIGQALVG
jgi:alpha-ketoglutarate-dependent taurine dioxygenase